MIVPSSPVPSPINSDLNSMGSDLAQLGKGLARLGTDAVDALADFLSLITHNLGVRAAGIVVGLILASMAWIVTFVALRLRASKLRRQEALGPAAAPRQKTDACRQGSRLSRLGKPKPVRDHEMPKPHADMAPVVINVMESLDPHHPETTPARHVELQTSHSLAAN